MHFDSLNWQAGPTLTSARVDRETTSLSIGTVPIMNATEPTSDSLSSLLPAAQSQGEMYRLALDASLATARRMMEDQDIKWTSDVTYHARNYAEVVMRHALDVQQAQMVEHTSSSQEHLKTLLVEKESTLEEEQQSRKTAEKRAGDAKDALEKGRATSQARRDRLLGALAST